ncbi:hypothetical protein ACIA5E_00410 [Nocardia asteroides]|uniref:hypothetical protein n=1 Tax=Nocardia asteroides TaxID=1824 RepID=UPI0037AEA196
MRLIGLGDDLLPRERAAQSAPEALTEHFVRTTKVTNCVVVEIPSATANSAIGMPWWPETSASRPGFPIRTQAAR